MTFDLPKFRKQLIHHEGLRLKPYDDQVGKTTIGVGRNLDDVGISLDEAMFMLDHDIGDRVAFFDGIPWFDGLDDVRQRVVLDMAFQLGRGGFMHFVETIDHILAGDFAAAADSMKNSKWAKQTPVRCEALSTMMRTGQDVINLT